VTESVDFRSSLTDAEVATIEWWLDLGSRFLREHTDTGALLPGWSASQYVEKSSQLDSALAKAPVYSGVLYRGAAGSQLWPEYVGELRRLVHSTEDFAVSRHLSASISKDIGCGHCFLEPEDPSREISVLFVLRVTSARLLAGFVHRAKDEQEVVIIRGSRFRRIETRRLPSPRPNQEFWRIELEQVA
jgi:hypothetical protein